MKGLTASAASFDVRTRFTLSIGFFYVRICVYVLLTLLAFQGLITAVVHSAAPPAFFKEDGPWEWVEFAFIVASSTILLINAHVNERYRVVLLPLGLLAAAVAVRELDHFLGMLTFEGAYKLVIGPIVVFCSYFVWKHHQIFAEALVGFSKTAPFYFIFLGFVVSVVYAQLIGQQDFWKAIVDDTNARFVKRAIEEILEVLGYILILFGAVEAFFIERHHRSQDGRFAQQ